MDILTRWEYELRASGLSPRTIRACLDTVRKFEKFGSTPCLATPEDVTRFLTACLERYAASTAAPTTEA